MTVASIQDQIAILEEKEQRLLSEDKIDADELNLVRNRLSELRYELGQLTATVQSVDVEVVEDPKRTPFEFVEKFNFDNYAGTPDNLLNSIVQTLLNEKAAAVAAQFQERLAKLESELAGETEQRINLQYQNQQHQGNIQLLSESNLALTEEKNRYKGEYEDFKSRFEAAAAALVEKDAEIERLKQRECDLQEQIARAPAPTVRTVIDVAVTDDFDALIRKAEAIKQAKYEEEKRLEAERLANRPKITNVRWEKEFGVGAKTTRLAELVGTYPGIGVDGETITIGTFEFNKFQEVSNEEARFLREQAQSAEQAAPAVEAVEPVQEASAPLVTGEVTPPEVQFPQEVGPVEGLDTTVTAEVAGQEFATKQELETFKEYVEKRFAELLGEEVV
ncbi:hypothetical protein [Gorillibacterium sp. sgz5001074]|uniref:hypothetical protein n=1 Tax=Gorillibacterium sp. sgz5001074 TaxID=3446695 RepID=UPI003F663A4C